MDEELKRWRILFAGNLLANSYLTGEELDNAELAKVKEIAKEWRERLIDISWFMRCLNEYVACMANREEGFEGRFYKHLP